MIRFSYIYEKKFNAKRERNSRIEFMAILYLYVVNIVDHILFVSFQYFINSSDAYPGFFRLLAIHFSVIIRLQLILPFTIIDLGVIFIQLTLNIFSICRLSRLFGSRSPAHARTLVNQNSIKNVCTRQNIGHFCTQFFR